MTRDDGDHRHLTRLDVFSRPFWDSDLLKLLPGGGPWGMADVQQVERSAAFRVKVAEAKEKASRNYRRGEEPEYLLYNIESLPEAQSNVLVKTTNEVFDA